MNVGAGDRDVEDDLQLLHQLAERHRIDQMRPVVKRAIERQPDHPSLLYYAAVIDWEDDDLDAAEATLGTLLQREPGSFEGRCLLASVLEQKKNLAGAEQLYIGLLRDYPRDASVYADYAMLMLKTMHVDKAAKLSAHAVTLDPDDPKVLQASTFCKMVANPGREAEAELEELLRKHPDSLRSALTLASYLAETGRYSEALPIMQQALREIPHSEELVDAVVELKAASHWSMLPLKPLQKWGWHASIAIWIAAVAGFRFIDRTPLAPYAFPIGVLFFLFVVYSWVWPPLLKRFMR